MTRTARRRLSAFAVLAIAMLLAQVGALAHGYVHLRAKGEPVGTGTTSSQVCTECLSFTPLLSAVGTSSTIVIFHPPCLSEAPRMAAVCAPGRRPTHAFRSRAPPALV